MLLLWIDTRHLSDRLQQIMGQDDPQRQRGNNPRLHLPGSLPWLLARHIQRRRIALNLAQADIQKALKAAGIDTTQRAISRWETEAVPKLEYWETLAEILDSEVLREFCEALRADLADDAAAD